MAKNQVKELQQLVRWYERKAGKIRFICDIVNICNSAGYYADFPKETKVFWSRFAQECIENQDEELNKPLMDFLCKKREELGGIRKRDQNVCTEKIKMRNM